MHIAYFTGTVGDSVKHFPVYNETAADPSSNSQAEIDPASFSGTGNTLRQAGTVYIIFHRTGQMKPFFHVGFVIDSCITRNGIGSMKNNPCLRIHHACRRDRDTGRLLLFFFQIIFHKLHCLFKNCLPAFLCPGRDFPFNQDLAGFCEKAVFDIGSANIQTDVSLPAAHRIKVSIALSMSSAA